MQAPDPQPIRLGGSPPAAHIPPVDRPVDLVDGAAQASPRVWALPDEPGPEVQALRDHYRRIWTRHPDGWARYSQLLSCTVVESWPRLFDIARPLTDATAAMPRTGLEATDATS